MKESDDDSSNSSFDGDDSEQRVHPMIGTAVGQRLRDLYDGFAREPIPDRFSDLIEKLREQTDGSPRRPQPDGKDAAE